MSHDSATDVGHSCQFAQMPLSTASYPLQGVICTSSKVKTQTCDSQSTCNCMEDPEVEGCWIAVLIFVRGVASNADDDDHYTAGQLVEFLNIPSTSGSFCLAVPTTKP